MTEKKKGRWVEQRIREKASEFATDPDVLRMELEKGGDRQRLKDMLLAESTLDYLTEKGRGTSVPEPRRVQGRRGLSVERQHRVNGHQWTAIVVK